MGGNVCASISTLEQGVMSPWGSRPFLVGSAPAVMQVICIAILVASSALFLSQHTTVRNKNNGMSPSHKENSQQSPTGLSQIETFIARKIKKLNPAINADQLSRLIVNASMTENIDPLILASIIKHESTFKGEVFSNKGAAGLMQIMPSTARYISQKLGPELKSERELLKPDLNIRMGIRYLHYLKERFNGDTTLALIAYNWGPTNLSRSLKERSPVNTSALRYARNILALHAKWDSELKLTLRS
ncbi:MAG: lytic transglycosylase domain-containing protein [Deltaproteobacteria bacterium]|nr:lytic transglycosylase domain-containing protein [Deltaproteobacteria bacterium]